MTTNSTILDDINPEIAADVAVRADEVAHGASTSSALTAALALGSIPVAMAALSRDVYAQGTLPANIKGVLDFALALEIFENEFYKAVLGTSAVAALNTAFAPVRALAVAVPGAVASLQQIQKHEAAHVACIARNGRDERVQSHGHEL